MADFVPIKEVENFIPISEVSDFVPVTEEKTSVMDYIKQHPFKSILQPLPVTLGGRAPGEVLYEKFGEKPGGERYLPSFLRSFSTGVAGDIADIATTPASFIPLPIGKALGKIPVKGTTVGEIATKIPIGRGFGARVRSLTQEPVTQTIAEKALETDPVNKIIQALKEAKPIRKEQEKIYSQIKSKQAGELAKIGTDVPGEQGFLSQLRSLKGELPKVQFEGIRNKITQPDIDSLFNRIETNEKLLPFDKINAKTGLSKLLGAEGGSVPTTSELNLLKGVFSDDFVNTVLSKRPLVAKMQEALGSAINVPRAIMASFDLSAPLRQGIFFIGRPKQWIPAFGNMFKYAFSEKSYQGLMDDIAKRPTYNLMRESGLSLTDLGSSLTAREERIMSNLPEKIPGIGRIIRGSNRAYTGFLNKLRADVFDDLVMSAEKHGLPVEGKLLNDISTFIGSATGRGKLPSALERSAIALNAVFFSPKLMASRLNLLNPVYYTRLDPMVRKEALKSLLTFSGTAMSILGLAKMGGANVGTDPRSADFGKIKVDNTRYDILGGFQQYLRLGAQLLTGEMVSSTTGVKTRLGEGYKPPTRFDIVQRFIESKEAPVASFISSLMKGKTSLGKDLDIPKELGIRFVPMVIQDAYDIAQERGIKDIPMVTPAIFGVGAQTYSSTASESVYAANSVLKNWKELIKQGREKDASLLIEKNKDLIGIGKKIEPIKKTLTFYEKLKKDAQENQRLLPPIKKQLITKYDIKIKEFTDMLEAKHKQLKK